MAITYNVAKCRKGWGVYVRAISGEDLKILLPNEEEKSIRVISSRLARRRSKNSAKNFIRRISDETTLVQLSRIVNHHLTIVEKNYQIIQLTNLSLFREHNNQFIKQSTSTDADYVESLALYYSVEREKESFIRKGATKYVKVPLNVV